MDIRRQFHTHFERTDGSEFIYGLSPCSRACEVDQVQDHAAWLAVEMAIEHSSPLDLERDFASGRPSNEVRQKISVIGKVVPSKSTVQVRREEGDASAASGAVQD